MDSPRPGLDRAAALVASFVFGLCGAAHAADAAASAPAATSGDSVKASSIPDVPLIDQNGNEVRFYSDLVRDHTVAINFIFTTCKTICPPLSANFSKLQDLLGDDLGQEVRLISVSVDPVVDTPERLHAWAAKFGARPGWSLLTGDKNDVDTLLKAIKVFTPDVNDHSPIVLVGNARKGEWKRVYGLAPPKDLADAIHGVMPEPAPEDEEPSAAAAYFTDIPLIDQSGRELRLYSDLLEGHVVVIDSFFTSCTGICPVMSATMARIQETFRDRVGKDVRLISVSVDPETDTPDRLAEYAQRYKAGPGWYFLTGDKANVEKALYKLGHYVEDKESHKSVMIVGNEPTGLWKKALGLAPSEQVIEVVRSVMENRE